MLSLGIPSRAQIFERKHSQNPPVAYRQHREARAAVRHGIPLLTTIRRGLGPVVPVAVAGRNLPDGRQGALADGGPDSGLGLFGRGGGGGGG
ncbi:unnamed protein product [Echinostoma caproni]|uniref:Copine domain-containing protein n=1 Tax=Echinostoma caproni TaxID=27848 RepID=A0A183AGD5_9TREM|nr:unnamed protein product [Echinostoma caproni]